MNLCLGGPCLSHYMCIINAVYGAVTGYVFCALIFQVKDDCEIKNWCTLEVLLLFTFLAAAALIWPITLGFVFLRKIYTRSK